jgi:hypothetical protein
MKQVSSIEMLANLIDDTPKVAFDHYGKGWGQHDPDPLWAAIGITNNQTGCQAARRIRKTGGPTSSTTGTQKRSTHR